MEMLEKADLDVVAVVVRVPIHHQLAMDVLRAGKHVYTEWPLGANLQEAQEMADLARENGVLSMVGLQSRVAPVFLTLRDLIADGYVGDVLSVNLWCPDQGIGPNVAEGQHAGSHNANNTLRSFDRRTVHVLGRVRERVGNGSHSSPAVARNRHRQDGGRDCPG